jgi:hypothetical protein
MGHWTGAELEKAARWEKMRPGKGMVRDAGIAPNSQKHEKGREL